MFRDVLRNYIMVIGWWDLFVNVWFREFVVFIEDFWFVEVVKDVYYIAMILVVRYTIFVVNVFSGVY